MTEPLITNDAIVAGILMLIIGTIFYTSQNKSKFFTTFYRFVPALLLCYFIPALFSWPFGIISGEHSKLYFVASRYFLPASLIFLCISIDIKALFGLGRKSLIMFFAAFFGVVLGGPVALWVASHFFQDAIQIPKDELWRGMSTIAGSWIGGNANQTAMKEIYSVSNDLFGTMLVVDVIVANIWMGFLLYGATISDKIDRWTGADNTAIRALTDRVSHFRQSVEKNPTTSDLIILMAIGFGGVGLAHLLADITVPIMQANKEWLDAYKLSALNSDFFWMVFYATTFGLLASFTRLRKLEGVGASKWGSVFIYFLVATIGMNMDILKVIENLGLFFIGIVWMVVHVTILLVVAYIIKAPFFFVAVGSQANIGGAASAPVVASAFNSSLAAVGALMAVLGYALGTYGAIICAQIMSTI